MITLVKLQENTTLKLIYLSRAVPLGSKENHPHDPVKESPGPKQTSHPVFTPKYTALYLVTFRDRTMHASILRHHAT